MGDTFFEIIGLEKSFRGLKATNNVSLSIKKGEVCSIIGPNGAGKTTLFNLITGLIKPDAGKIYFMGKDITGHSPVDIVHAGIARSFQIVNNFPRFTVYDNIMIAALGYKKLAMKMFTPAKGIAKNEIMELIDRIGLAKEAHSLAGELSHGDQKRLEVGIALASHPSLLLLDEPTAGMSSDEKGGILETIKRVMKESDCTVFLCEHDMKVIFSVSDTIWVLHNGAVVTSGTVDEIRNNSLVKEIYLGEAE
ncbi:MAG TPA: ABC transporter ATP-binding protein [Syntrophorhabdus sp.]|jgi:branched-chain amino acid transport system ATP-binding protein|nr:ABC transporter ATP-binding protein [Syntrophorhabdus sp.]